MAPKATVKKNKYPQSDPHGMFSGMTVFLIETGVQTRRLQIWKQKLVQMGASIEDRFSKRATHIFAVNLNSLLQKVDREHLTRYKGKVLDYQWLEDSLRVGKKVSEDSYILLMDAVNQVKLIDENHSSNDEPSQHKKIRSTIQDSKAVNSEERDRTLDNTHNEPSEIGTSSASSRSVSPEITGPISLDGQNKAVSTPDVSLLYKPPDLNRNITEVFGKLIDIYRALGDDRRSFSYHKAILVIEKLPFKIESADQVKHLAGIGKSMQDHIQEIVTTGKLSKLEHFENDEKIRSISLFGEIWGIGPATALKLYEKGHRTLDDLKHEESLTNAQRLGLKYFDDIKTRIPRHEVQEMESLLKKVGEEILPGVVILVICLILDVLNYHSL
ncbi:DNA polymerase lambda isoform X1 [Olea europaea subsp. europaea]|uniref:DNA polymerase n=1 Tax=Olea europaea subsp. europaea TaxID=158383 RepID=A0A8S0PP00_OLEEU|nr:DNA polymerase lambda isoform X1 [Olea europaea subsp. europaea]